MDWKNSFHENFKMVIPRFHLSSSNKRTKKYRSNPIPNTFSRNWTGLNEVIHYMIIDVFIIIFAKELLMESKQ